MWNILVLHTLAKVKVDSFILHKESNDSSKLLKVEVVFQSYFDINSFMYLFIFLYTHVFLGMNWLNIKYDGTFFLHVHLLTLYIPAQ